jgi:hypothetical protein
LRQQKQQLKIMSKTTKFLLWIYFVAVCAIGAGHTLISPEDPLFKNQQRVKQIYHSAALTRHRGPHAYTPQAQIRPGRAAPQITASPPQANNQKQKETQ